MTAVVGFLAALMLAAYLAASVISAGRTVRWLKRITRTERTRSQWAEAREELFCLVRAGKLDIRSETFRVFYGLQTFVMRRPEAYDEFSRQITRGLGQQASKAREASWSEEAATWPPEMAQVLRKMALGIGLLATAHAGRTRFWWLFFTRVLPWVGMRLGRDVSARISRALVRTLPGGRSERRLWNARDQLEQLASRAANNRPQKPIPAAV